MQTLDIKGIQEPLLIYRWPCAVDKKPSRATHAPWLWGQWTPVGTGCQRPLYYYISSYLFFTVCFIFLMLVFSVSLTRYPLVGVWTSSRRTRLSLIAGVCRSKPAAPAQLLARRCSLIPARYPSDFAHLAGAQAAPASDAAIAVGFVRSVLWSSFFFFIFA